MVPYQNSPAMTASTAARPATVASRPVGPFARPTMPTTVQRARHRRAVMFPAARQAADLETEINLAADGLDHRLMTRTDPAAADGLEESP
ncbi:hypothetical protein GCM10022255_074690 [Dactylosporangium darangshiense]|uniref:Uncharacterized protein n=1 Tax=Dactylosporangium darangshiense TaxID=579108 RepID=A0ABP8DJE8_9ACTN